MSLDDPTDFTPREGTLLMEFPCAIKSLWRDGDRLFAVLDNGQSVEVTELLGDAKH